MIRLRQEQETTSSSFDASRRPLAATRRRALPLLTTLFLASALMSGCSGSTGKGLSPGNWFGSGSSTAKKPAKTLYTKTDGLQVHADHDGSSKTLGRLKAGEKVLRTQTSGAWSRIEARGGDLRGWVPSSQIGSRPSKSPAATGPGSSAEAAAPETAPAASEAEVEAQVEAAEAEADAKSEADPAQAEAEAAASEDEAAHPVEAAGTPATPPATAPAGAGAGASPSKKGQVAPSVFDPY